MPAQGPGGSIPVARGTPTTRRVGSDGTGKSKGGGGAPTATGTATIRTVSVASLKRRPKPIGDTDFVDARKNYPAAARRLSVEGSIKVRLVIDAEGTVRQRKLIKKLGHGLDELALRLAAKLRFEPAIDTDDKPVAAVVVWTFHFTLPS